MATGDDARRGRGAPLSIVKSGGEAEAKGFVEADLPDEPVHPTMEMDRVQVVDPRHSPTLPRIEMRKVSGPRAPDQLTRPEAPGAVPPLERPATKMQPIKIDPEMLLTLSRQAAEKAARPSTPGAPPMSDPGPAPRAPVLVREAADDGMEDRVTLPMRPKVIPIPIPIPKIEASGDPVASPWENDAGGAPIAASELPSALAPSTRSDPAPASEKQAGVAPPGGRLLRVMVPLAVLALLGFAVLQMMPKDPRKEEVGAVPVPSGVESVTPAVLIVPALEPSGAARVAPTAAPPAVGTVESDAGARPAPIAPTGVAPIKPKIRNDDPYDAAAPLPAKTVEVLVQPAPVPPASALPVPVKNPVEGDRVFGN